ncbi:alpha-glucosidase-like [Belonocnema kinseyi]|uniref:alpha-glucosidase-like n=1 Tax=Belonocnema kinseyi TaxID=2817044 RepID=UPI00143D70E7|nr:alpha-glucosidase-like [Belonocnema kinseyi]XP_033230358.1 alpha-glucosidase-like [Belonocnema kinseyi]
MKICLALWVTMLFSCAVKSERSWWKTMSIYQIYPKSFKDSDGDGIGDLKGIESKLDHLVDSHVNAFWLSPVTTSPMVDNGYDISDFVGIDPSFGTMEDFESLVKKAHELKLKVVLDFVPNHSSDQHEWFKKSVEEIEPYTDYYVWHEGRNVNGTLEPPNNWRSEFNGSAWTWNEKRGAFYLHQFTKEQPDLNYRNQGLVEEMKNVLRFWMEKGVDGIRIDACPYLFEDPRFLDEPLSGKTTDPNSKDYTIHIYTKHQHENYEMIQQWRDFIDEYSAKVDQVPRVMIVEAYANISSTMKYYKYGADFPFNFGLMDIVNSSEAIDVKNNIERWMTNLPSGSTPNWVAGNHDNFRLVSRLGVNRAMAITAMVLLLPGAAVTYNGEEIGMIDTPIDSDDPARFRDPARSPFQWDFTVSAGFSTNPKTWLPVNKNYLTHNLLTEKADCESYYSYYKALAFLRKLPAVQSEYLQLEVLKKDILAFARKEKGEKSVYVLSNFGDQIRTVSLGIFKNTPAILLVYRSTPGILLKPGSLVESYEVSIPPSATIVLMDI